MTLRRAEFMIPGQPIPWQRVRTKGGQFFTAPETREAEKVVAHFARRCRAVWATGNPIRLVCRFYRMNRIRCDVDNMTKLIQDALNGLTYLDDSQIVDQWSRKFLDREQPRTEIEIEELSAEEFEFGEARSA